MLRLYDAEFSDLEDLALLSRVGHDNLLLNFKDQWSAGDFTAFYTRIETEVLEHGAELLVLDSLHDFFGGNENSRPHARQFVAGLRTIAVEMHGAVLLTAHPSLTGRNSGTGEAGSTAWSNAVRSRLYLIGPRQDDQNAPDRDYRELRVKKANYGAAGDAIRLRWREGVFVREERTGGGIVATLELDRDLIDGLRLLITNGAFVPADPNAPKSFANAVRTLPSCKKYDWALIRAAQERLIANGKIERVEMGPASKRRIYIRPADMTYPGEIKGAAK